MSQPTLRVLLVDDEKSLREPLAEHLRREPYGYQVDAAVDGTQALGLIEESHGRYDVVLMDEVLGEGPSGLDVLDRVKFLYPEMQVILFTGWGLGSGLAALRAGAYRYFAKPFNVEELALTIQFAAEKGQERRERKILNTFHQVTAAINSTLELGEILRRTCQAVVELFGFDHSGVVLFDQDCVQGKVFAEYPASVMPDGPGALSQFIPVRGVRAEERLVHAKEILNIPDLASEESLGPVREILINLGVRSILIVPVIIQDRVVASFSLDSVRCSRTFNSKEIELCKSLADQVAVAMENARLLQEASQGREYLRSLYLAGNAIIAPRDPNQVLQSIVDRACQATGAWRAVVLLVDEDLKKRTRVLAETGFGPASEPTEVIRADGISIHVLRSGKAYFACDFRAPQQDIAPNPRMLLRGTRAAACLPLPLLGRNIGVLWVEFRDIHNFSDTEKHALQLYGTQSAIAYDNARRMQELEQMRAASEAMASVSDVKQVLRQIVHSARQVLGADSAVIWSYDSVNHRFFPDEMVGDQIADELVQQFREVELRPGGTAEKVMQEGYLGVTDVEDPEYDFLGTAQLGLRGAIEACSFQGVALRVSDETLGILYVNYHKPRSFSPEDQVSLKTFANHAALALKKARLVEQLHRTRQAAGVVAQIMVQEDLKQTLRVIAEHTQRVLNASAVNIYSYDEEKDRFGEWVVVGANHPEAARPPEQLRKESVVNTLLQIAEPFYCKESEAHQNGLLNGHFVRTEGIEAAFGIRLEAGGRKVGVLFVNFRSRHRFSDDEIETIRLFAFQAAVAIRGSQLHDETEKRAQAFEGLYDAGKVITSTLTLTQVLERITEQGLRILGARQPLEGCFTHVALLEGHKLAFIAASPGDVLDVLQKDITIDLESGAKIGISGRAVVEKRSQNVSDVAQDPDYISVKKKRTRSELAVPICTGDQVIGVISIEHPELYAFSPRDQQHLELLAAQAAVAIQNARRFEDLTRMKGMVGSKTAMDWMRMVSTAWGHAVRREASVAKNYLELIRQGLFRGDVLQAQEDLSKLTAVIEHVKDIPILAPLAAEDSTTSVQINTLLRQYLPRLWQREPNKSVELLWKLQLDLDDMISIRASPEWMRRALEVLVDNAVEAMSRADIPTRRLTIATQLGGGAVEVSIQDTGGGIPTIILPQLFDAPIEKLPGSRGAGLGLILAKIIVETYGGRLYVKETGPTGTTMVIAMPIEKKPTNLG